MEDIYIEESTTKSSNRLIGTIFAISAGIMWGLGGICAQFLFKSRGLSPQWLVGVRLISSGLILLSFGYFKTKNDIFKIWTHKEDRISLILFSIFGMLGAQFTFFTAISQSNAATATVIQYLSPALVLIYVSIKNKKVPSIIEIFAVILSIIGVFVLVTHGNFNNLLITKTALIWCILAAITLAYYTIKPTSFKVQWTNYSLIGWAMIIGGIVCNFINPIWKFTGVFDFYTLIYSIAVIVIGTIIPFSIYSVGVRIIGPTNASLYSCVEPVATALISVVFLGTPFKLMDYIGTALIVSMIIILSLSKK